MKKIPTLFARNPDDRRYVIDEVTPGCEWVLAGEGVATRKYDGTCVRLTNVPSAWGLAPLLRAETRREVKSGRPAPEFFEAVETDPVTGKTVGWEPYACSGFARFIEEALGDYLIEDWPEGTYELVGPKINGNPERFEKHALVRHGSGLPFTDVPLHYDELADYMRWLPYEGIVWHHPDGRMVKLKVRDFPPFDDRQAS